MGVRKKGKTRFEYLGRYYYWLFDNWHIRIASEDKKFVVAYFMDGHRELEPHLEVIGQEFPGIKREQSRPVRLYVPKFVTDEWEKSTGAFINALIRWSLRESHQLKYYSPPSSEK